MLGSTGPPSAAFRARRREINPKPTTSATSNTSRAIRSSTSVVPADVEHERRDERHAQEPDADQHQLARAASKKDVGAYET
jgi:hypothetical protein